MLHQLELKVLQEVIPLRALILQAAAAMEVEVMVAVAEATAVAAEVVLAVAEDVKINYLLQFKKL
jgi:hypothetical protein